VCPCTSEKESLVSTPGDRPPGRTRYEQIQASSEFVKLRARLRRFVFPMSVAFLAWYLLYVLLAAYQPEFMSIKLAGNLNVGLLIGVLQFVSTFVITTIYVSYANKHLDPSAEQIRGQLEGSDEE
jgi:uncharacterized membrane protein (DUF485 family)